MSDTIFLIYIFTFIIFYSVFAILYIIKGGRITMDYKLALRNLFEMVEIVLTCTFTVIHMIGSVILFISALCIDKLGHASAQHTIDISMFGYEIKLSTKRNRT